MGATTYAAAIRAARKSLGLSVAKASTRVGVSPATIKRWEAGQGMPPRADLQSYLDNLGVPADSLCRSVVEEGIAPTGFRERKEMLAERPVMRFLRSRRRKNSIRLADLSDLTGLSVPTIHRYETGQREPDPEDLSLLAKAAGCSAAEVQALLDRVTAPPGSHLSVEEISADFLDPDNMASFRVYELLERVVLTQDFGSSDVWNVLHGLLIMGEHKTILEVWPALKTALTGRDVDLSDKVLLRSTLAMVRSVSGTSESPEPSAIQKLATAVNSLRPGMSQSIAMLQMARLALAVGDHDGAREWIGKLEVLAPYHCPEGTLFLVELNRHAIDYEETRSASSIRSVEDLRSSALSTMQAYNLDVALSHMHDIHGDEVSVDGALEQCDTAERSFGFGSPLAAKVRTSKRSARPESD
ncbi:MAG: helix-turn-helix domain-containing protein [Armatimonadetes bacterium]|nr:helix-turn-helix domain-containing protein [Armatimonadota bacterium]